MSSIGRVEEVLNIGGKDEDHWRSWGGPDHKEQGNEKPKSCGSLDYKDQGLGLLKELWSPCHKSYGKVAL